MGARRCLACRAAVAGAGGAPVRRLHAARLPWLRQRLPRCGLPTHRARGMPGARCGVPAPWAPVAYEGVARDLVGALKFHAALPAADVMAAHIAANLSAWLRAVDAALVPVPAAPAHRRARGFDPRGPHAGAGATDRAAARGLPDPRGPHDPSSGRP